MKNAVLLVFLLLSAIVSSQSFKAYERGLNAKEKIDYPLIHSLEFLNAAIINYDDPSEILKLKKLELGVQLPEKFQQQIDAFLAKNNRPETQLLNPFLEWEVDVEATFVHEESNQTKTIDGFYYRNFQRNYEKNSWDDIGTPYPFRIRFAPSTTGSWTCFIHLKVKGQLVATAAAFTFNVIESEDPGYVTRHSNGKNFALNGEAFIPIGQNFPAPDSGAIVYHNTVQPELQPNETANATPLITWMHYLAMLDDYGKQGGKYFRTIQTPWSSLIEFEEKGNYYDRLKYAWEQDKVLEICEKYDMRLLFNFLLHSPIMNYSDYHFYDWDWGNYSYDGVHSPEYPYPVYAYNDNPGVKQPHEMFLNKTDMAFQKQRIRYLVSRYGYSTKIYGFELLSEPFHLSEYWKEANSNPPFYDTTHPDHKAVLKAVYNYHSEISKYIKKNMNHTEHLIGVNTSYYLKTPWGMPYVDSSIFIPEVDFLGLNRYFNGLNAYLISGGTGKDDFTFYKGENSTAEVIHHYQTLTGKIVVISEGANINGKVDCMDEYNAFAVDCASFIFSGAAGFSPWDGYQPDYDPIWNTSIGFNSFLREQGGDVLERGYQQGRQKEKVKILDDALTKEMQYFLSNDQKHAIGYIQNMTYNYVTSSDSSCYNDRNDYPSSLTEKKTITYKDGPGWYGLTLQNLEKGKYKIRYWNGLTNKLIEEKKIEVKGKEYHLKHPPLTVDGKDHSPILYFKIEPL